MKILMYLNIPWEFIKQRPQFLAEKLGKYINLSAYYNKAYKNNYTVENDIIPKHIQLISKIKVPRKNSFLKKCDNYLQRVFLKSYINDADYIWIMHPDQYEILEPMIDQHKVIYDCMDDYGEFPHLKDCERDLIKRVEKKLIKRADYIFYTSKTLQIRHQQKYCMKRNTFVVNNAMEPSSETEDYNIKIYLEKINQQKLVYIGAIAPWFDFESIIEMLNNNGDICLILFGPIDCALPEHKQIYYYGKIQHQSIYTAMNYADILIMPFKLNQLIEAVDPIKIYEYIASSKPVIVPEYVEMEKFKPFVITYNSIEQLSEIVKQPVSRKNLMSIEQFIQENTWEERAKQIVRILTDEN